MKKARNFWRDLPQGGSRYGSVLTRLFLLLCLLATTQAGWADSYTETYTNPTGANPPAGAAGLGAFTKITVGDGVSLSNNSINQSSNGGSGNFTISTLDGSYITGITMTETGDNYVVSTLTSTDGELTYNSTDKVWSFTPNTQTKTSVTFSMTSPSGKKARLAPIVVNLKSDYEYLSKNFSVSSGTVSCTKSNVSSDLTLTTTGSVSSYYLQIGSGKTLTITSAAHNIKAIHFTYQGHANITSMSASTGTYSNNSWTAGNDTKTVTFTSSATNNIAGISVELEDASSAPTLVGASSSPAASATNVAVSGTGYLKFSKNLSSVTAANITISPNSNGEALSSIAIDGTDASKVNYTWSGLQKNTEYTINVAANAVSDGTDVNAATSLSFTTVAKAAAGLSYGTSTVNKNVGDASFTNTLTNPNTLSGITYSITSTGTGSSINSSTGEVTVGSSTGTETITATFAGNEDYNSGTATYTLKVKAAAAGLTTLSAVKLDFTDKDEQYPSWIDATDINDLSSITDNADRVVQVKGVRQRTKENDTNKRQRIMLNYVGGSAKAITTTSNIPDDHFMKIKVAAYSKVEFEVYGDNGSELFVTDGSVANLLTSATCDKTVQTFTLSDTGASDKELYIYPKTNTNISIFSINVKPTYAITSSITGSGTVTTKIGDETVTRAASGETVTITATPGSGADLTNLTVTKTAGGASVDVTSSNTFTMPAEAVTVNATFGAGSAAAPTFQPGASTISAAQTITLTSATENAHIYYTTDGSTPTSSSTPYTGPFTLGNSATVKAIAYDSSNANPSAVSSKTYTVDATAPTLSSTSPTNGSTGRGTSGTISLTFDEAVAVANASGITISPSTGVTWGTATVDSENANKVNITVSGLANSTEYTVTTASGAITDAVGNPYTGGSFSFTTGAAATTIVLEKTGSSGTTFDDGSNTSSASFNSTSVVSDDTKRSPLSTATGQVYRTSSINTITLTLNSTSASEIVIGAKATGSNRTLSSVEINGSSYTSYTTSGSFSNNGSVERLTVSGLNVPQGGTVTFAFSGNMNFYYFEVTSGSGDVPPTFTTSPADNASGVAVDAAVTLTADKDISAVGSTIAGTLNDAACTFTLGGDNRTLTLTKAGNFANATQYTVVLNAGQVQDGNGIANTATEFTFTTVAAVVPTIAFNNPTTSITVGGSTVTNTATKTNASEAAITYSSSNTSVATVDPSTGEVTAVSAGNTVITASMTVGSTEYTASYNMTVNAASVASTKWDFTTLSSDEIAAMRANTDKLSEVTSDKYFKNQSWSNPYNFKNSSGTDLNVTDGLLFGGSTSNNKFQYYYGDDKRIRIQSNAHYVQLPTQEAGTEINITWKAISSSRTLTADNATVKGSSNKYAQLSNGTTGTSTFIVDATGTVKFTVSGTLDLYKIEVGSAIEVAAPTIAPASGTHEGENNKSVTFTQNADNTGGTLTTHYVVGTAAATSAATVAAGTSVTSGTPETIDLSSYETDVVISAVTKFVDGSSNTYYSDITTATYTYNGKVTPEVEGTEMNLHPGDFGDIIGHITITDKQGNPLRFGEEEGEEVNYEDYFTFTYSIDAGSTSAAETAKVTLSDGRLSCAEDGVATTGNGIKINITAVPKAAAADYVKGTVGTTEYTGSLWVKVTPKQASGYEYVGLYWDKDFSAASELKEGTDYEVQQIDGINYYVLTVPNSRMLYLKNTGIVDDLCFYYKQNSTVPSMSLNHVNDKSSDQYKYRYGIPIFTSDDGAGTIWIMIAGYKQTTNDKGETVWSREGSFLRLKVNVTAKAKETAPRYEPTDANTHMNTMKPATAYTVDDANSGNPNDDFQIVSKFTSKNSELPIMQHFNYSGSIYGEGSTSVYSTEVANRQISGVQTVKKTVDGRIYYYISSMSKKLYTFDFGTTLHLSEQEINVTTDGTTVTPADVTEPTVTGTYWDKKQTKDVEISYANEYITYEVIKSPKTDEETPVNGVTISASTGAITIDPKTVSGEAIIRVTYAGGYDETTGEARTGSAASNEPIEIKTDKTRTGYTGVATTTYTINITNTSEHVPDIDPAGRKFANTLNVTVSAPDADHFVRYYVSNGDDGTSPKTAEWLKANGTLIDKGNRATTTIGEGVAVDTKITVYAVAYSEAYTSRVVQETFEKVKPLPKPVFNPDGTETPYYYYNTAKLLEVTIMGTDGADIYYTFDDPNVSTASTPYDGQKKARVEGSKTIYAIAVKDGLRSEVAASRYVWTLNIDAPVFYLGDDQTILYPATAKTKEVTRTTDINLKATQGDIYYTLDGSDPSTDNGIKYSAGTPINLLKSVTAKAIAIDGDAISPITTMNFTIPEPAANDNDLWEAVEETTPGGTLPADGRVISIANGSPKAVKYITATFGGGHREVLGNTAWSKISIGEESQGSALDGVGKYSISVGSDAADETGAIYSHANAEGEGGELTAVSDRTFKIPAQGAFVRFEPERDGELTIWALQSGALHYTTKGDFCDKFIRRRPVYLIDEQGKSVTAKVTPVSSARLSSNWDNLKPDEFLDKNTGSQNGDVNTFYTSAENTAIYTMYEKILADNTGFGVGKDIHPVPMHTNAIYSIVGNDGVGDAIKDNTGYVMLSGGYVKYTFDVKAGKTYYFFGSRTKLGIRGFRFVADDTTPADITLTEESTSNTSAISAAVNSTRHTTGFDRTLAEGKWAGLVLPFSLSETQTKAVFGDDVEILHVDKVQNYYLNLVRHYYQMIVAGTPIFIKPSQDVNLADLDEYVQIENTTPETISIDGYNFTGYYNYTADGIAKGDYYMSASGNLSQRTKDGTTALKSLRSILKSQTGQTAKLTLAQGVIYEVDQQPLDESVVTPIEVIYDEATGDFTIINDDTIYNLNGQVVRKNAISLEGLPKGIYIVNGKKVSVK